MPEIDQQNKKHNNMSEIEDLKNQIAALRAEIGSTHSRTLATTPQSVLPQIPLPGPLKIRDGDISENFKYFKQQWENYLTATGLVSQNEEAKKAILLTAIGDDAFKRYTNMPIREEDRQTATALLNEIEKNLTPTVNKRYIRAVFNMAKQDMDESYDEYFNRLRSLIKNAQYGPLEDDLLLDKIICSIKDTELKEKLWLDNNITLTKAIEICRSKETTEKQLRGIDNKPIEINKVQKTSSKTKKQQQYKSTERRTCKFCGNEYHDKLEQCPARSATCHKCNRRGHYARVCMSNRNGNNSRAIREIETTAESDNETYEAIEEIMLSTTINNNKKGLYAKFNIHDSNNTTHYVKCQLDTGASCNLIGFLDLKNIETTPNINKSRTMLRPVEGPVIKPIGTTYLTIEHNGAKYKLFFYIIKSNHCPLFSLDTCLSLKLIEVCKNISISGEEQDANIIINKYKDVFHGLGKLKGDITLEIDNKITPRSEPPRRIPIALRKQLKDTLTEMEGMDVIVKEPEHTKWTSNIVLVKKKNKLRVCIDPKDLNEALKDIKYQLPTVEEILTELADAKIFTILDAKHGFWQLQLDDDSSKLTSFWTPFGKYRFKRVPFGIKPAMEIFQMRQNQVISGLKGVVCIADDILVFGKGGTKKEAIKDHNKNLEHLLQRLRKENLKINKEKMKVCQEEIKFFGHILTSEGIRPDPDKISAIVNMPTPVDKKDTLRFLGLITYVGKFIENMSEITEPLRRVTHAKADFVWKAEQEETFKKLKKLITETPVLHYYNVEKPVVIQTDASSFALGCTLLQDGHPIIYASKTLTPTQMNYAQIEKEMLAVLFACKRFDQYICGKKDVTIETDHSPLINIFKKPLLKTPKRLQSMILALQRYNFKIKYTKGSEMYIADTISRAPGQVENSLDIFKIEEEFKQLDENNDTDDKCISSATLDSIKRATTNDNVMTALMEAIRKGWPENKANVVESIKPYYNIRDELVINNHLVFKGNRLLIPQKMRSEMLDRLHQPHLGIEATLKLARETVYWRGITDDIKQIIQKCEICNTYARKQQREPLIIPEIPSTPFEIVSMDVCELNVSGKTRYFLITVDHYSDFFEIDELNSLSAKTTINFCRKNFSRYGIPVKVITDNGTNFVNSEFRKFATQWEFNHATSSPHHQQANGKAESAVKIAKHLIKKALASNTDFYKSLLLWRNTPNKMGSSPAKRMFCRWLRCNLPSLDLQQEVIQNVPKQIQQQRTYNKKYFDRGTRKNKNLKEGDNVYIKQNPNNKWVKGKIEQKITDRSYVINSDQKQYRRNTIHIMKPNATAPNSGPREIEADTYSRSSGIKAEQSHPETIIQQPEDILTESQNSDPHHTNNLGFENFNQRARRETRLPRRFDDYEVY